MREDRTERAWLAAAAFMAAFLIVITAASQLDGRTLNDVSVWAKPTKFSIALAVHFASLALLSRLLAPARRNGALMSVFVALSIAAGLFEIIYIVIQAARGRASHFNYETPIESILYLVMGAGALLLVLAPLVMGVLLARQKDASRSGLKLGAVIGLVMGPILTIIFAGYMSLSGGHFVGAPDASDAGGAPLFGWSLTLADMRPAHFVATHAIQILPLVGLAGDRLVPSVARPAVFAAAAAIALLSTSLFAIAVSGEAPLGFFLAGVAR